MRVISYNTSTGKNISCAFLCELTYIEGHENFKLKFKKSAHTRVTIKNLENEIKRVGSVKDEDCTDRLSIVTEVARRIQEVVTRNGKSSRQKPSRNHAIPNSTVWNTLSYRLNKLNLQYKTAHNLEAKIYAARQVICYYLLQFVRNEKLMRVKSSWTFSYGNPCRRA